MDKLGRLKGAPPEAPLSCDDFIEVHVNPVAAKDEKRAFKELQQKGGPFCVFPPKKRNRTRGGVIKFQNVSFASLTEAALAYILKCYIPRFELLEGKSYQIPLKGDSKADFMVEGCIIEFHSPRLGTSTGDLGDFTSRRDLLNFHHTLHSYDREDKERESYIVRTKKNLIELYRKKRERLISESQHKGRELIVVSTRLDFYELVIKRFAGSQTPTLSEFMALYWYLIEKIAIENGLPVNTLRKSQMNDRLAA